MVLIPITMPYWLFSHFLFPARARCHRSRLMMQWAWIATLCKVLSLVFTAGHPFTRKHMHQPIFMLLILPLAVYQNHLGRCRVDCHWSIQTLLGLCQEISRSSSVYSSANNFYKILIYTIHIFEWIYHGGCKRVKVIEMDEKCVNLSQIRYLTDLNLDPSVNGWKILVG